ncbi:MAG: hypothetical protein WBX25_34025, partial [Rhodomicrobium sp.]
MRYVVGAGKRGPSHFRAAVQLALGCVLLGGCSATSDRFSSFSLGSGYDSGPASRLPARQAAYAPMPAQTPQSSQTAQASNYRPQTPGGLELASASSSQPNGYLQVSRVDLPPLQQGPQGAQGPRMADGYGPYNRPPVADGTYAGPRVYTPYDQPGD